MGIIYKILLVEEYNKAVDAGHLLGAPIDLLDGFIHFSTATQAQETADKHFAGRGDIYLLAVDGSQYSDDILKYEISRGGDMFPHLYAPLDMDHVLRSTFIAMNDKGGHDLSVGIKKD